MESYNEIFTRMKENYEERAGIVISDESDIAIRLRVLAGEIFKQQQNEDFILRQMFPLTATGEYLDRHAQSRGITRKPALYASGNVQFYAEQGHTANVVIPQGTVVADARTAKRFVTDEAAVIRVGEEYVLTHVTAVEAGASSNARGGNISVLVTPVAGVTNVYNGSVFVNGCDEESDEMLRERIIESYVNISNGTNAAYYKALAMSVDGVYSAGAIGRVRGAGTVNVYVCAEGGPVTNSVLAEVQTLLSGQRELNVDVLACQAQEVDVSFYLSLRPKSGYSFDSVSAACRAAVTAYIDSLGIGRDVLITEISDLLYHTEGVENFDIHSLYRYDRVISDSQYALTDRITIAEVSG
ncbi:MAG: baseplate J/gp47 family protein [Ruminococcus sp.]|nr:baseplate J/gp47 family protein [Ruminococcus sp.]